MKWLSWCLLLLITLACLAMKKTSNEELNAWRYRDKGAPVSLSILGNPAIAYSHRGEAKSLLWSVKNALRLNKNMQGEGERRLADGTTIRVKSVFGFDIVEIDASRSTLAEAAAVTTPSCTITFINFPISVPPMRNPNVIAPTDMQGVDYFKSYYSFDVTNCPTCQEIAWDFLFDYAIPVEPRHYHNPWPIPQMGVDPGKDDPNNHSVYSLYPSAFGEIISHGADAGGTYIIWKAYTEAGSALIFSRTGLAILLINAFILDSGGTTICTQQAKIDVDCCVKDASLRNVEIWWEGVGECHPFMIYNSKHICLMPHSVSVRMLITYSTPFYAAQPLYALPEIKGSCIPLEWKLTGPIKLINPDPYGTATYFQITTAPGDCMSPVTITLEDRCGRTYDVMGSPCCEDADPLVINYTSLLMSCGQSQDFFVTGGCGPFEWAITSGGGTINNGHYVAPATNANCTDNPTITVTDCCGDSASVSLAINCYSGGHSMDFIGLQTDGCWCVPAGCLQGACCKSRFIRISYDCSGNVTSTCDPGWYDCSNFEVEANCSDDLWSRGPCVPGGPAHCFTNECGGCAPATCNDISDCRDGAMKADGCCPLNPLTGLPY